MPLLSLSQIRGNSGESSSSSGALKSLSQIRTDQANKNNAYGSGEMADILAAAAPQADLIPGQPTPQQANLINSYGAGEMSDMLAAAEPQVNQFPTQNDVADQARQLPVIGPVLKGLDAFANSPVVSSFDYAAGKGMGVPDNMMNQPRSTGSQIADKALELAGGTAGYLVNPGMPSGNLGVATNFFENPAINQAATAVGNRTQGLLPDAGLTLTRDGSQIVDSMLGKTVNKAAQGAVQGGLGAAAFSPFHTLETGGDVQDIPHNMLEEGLSGAALGGLLEGASPAVGKALQTLLARRGISAPEVTPAAYDQAAASRNVMDLGPANTAAQDEIARRFNFTDRNTFGSDNLALPPSMQEIRLNELAQNRPQPGTDPIPMPGDVRTFALPAPDVAPPTTARAAANPWRVKFDNLINVANQMDHPPGRELESLESLWSRMAGPNDPNLSELVDLAYPPSKVTPDTLRRAKDQQYARDVAGVSGPVKSMADRYDGGVKGEAAAPTELLKSMRKPEQPAVEVTPPKRKFATTDAKATKSEKTPITESEPVKPATTRERLKSLSEVKSGSQEQRLQSLSEIKPDKQAETINTDTKPEKGIENNTQNYAGNPIPFRQTATQNERTINRNTVVNNIRKNLGVTIDTGRLNAGPGVLGIHKVQPEVIRTRMSEDLQVISHEVGHNLDKRFGLQDPRFQNEYMALIHNNPVLNIAAYQPHQLPAEGVAEYVRLRLTDPAAARKLAPNFTRFFDSKLDPKTMKGLEASARDIDTWITQGDYNQAKGLIDFTSGTKKEGFGWNKFYSRFVDDLDPLRLVEKALKGKEGIGADSIYKMARLSRGISQRAEMAVKRGIYVGTQKVSDGLAEIVKPLEDVGMKEKDFATYLAVKHAVDLKAMGKSVPFDDAQIKAVMQKWDQNPVVQQAHQKIMKYNNALLDILQKAQILSPKAIQEMRQKYPNYVPFMRYFDDDAIAGFKNGGFGAAKGFANITNPVRKMTEEGSTRTIINPIESMVKNTFLVMNAAAKNKVGLQLADLAKIDGAGPWVEHVGEGGSSPHDHVVSVYENGVKQSYKVRNPDLYNAMLSLDTESSNSLIRFLGGAAGMLRAGATLTPDFMIRNMFRDVADAMVSSVKYGFNPLDVFKGLFHVLGKTDVYKQYISSGGAMGTMQSLDRDASREALKAVFQTGLKDKAMHVISSPKELAKMVTLYTPIKTIVGGLRHGAEISELSTRLGAFNRVLKKTGSVEEAAYQARDLMDFNRAGSAIRPANKAIAFLNANMQGIDRMRRSFLENPASFLVRAFTTLVLPSIGLYYLNHTLDPERQKLYDNIPQWQKDSFYIFPIPGTKDFARIPKPFEAGAIFATGTERVMRWLQGHDPEAFKDYGSNLAQTFTPPMMISALTPLLEATTNYSFFKNQPVVPQGERRFEKKDQYGLYTSETAKLIGQILSHTPLSDSNFASPRIIDNTINGYTAGLGKYAVKGIDKLIQATGGGSKIPQPTQSITEQQPLSSFLAQTTGGGQIRQDFYNKWNQLSAAEDSAKKNGVPYTDSQYYTMKAGKDVIDKLMQQYKMIQNSPTMSPDDKRAKLDDLDKFMNDISRQSLGK